MDFYYFEIASLWGTALVGTMATLFTVVTSDDRELRRYALFNLASFVLTTFSVHFVLNEMLPSYGQFFGLRKNWLPIEGYYIFLYLLFADYAFHLYHRFVHTVPLFWTGHYSHHSGRRLHLSLIVRDNILAHIFALPTGLLGIPLGLNPYGVFVGIRFVIFYQSFLHFHVKRDIPILKYLVVTPYNHIIHHSTTFEGTGQNFGGILNFWDRLCGSYKEGDKYLVEFGLNGAPNVDSLWQLNTKPLFELFRESWRSRSLRPLFLPKGVDLRPRSFGTLVIYFFAVLLMVDIALLYFQLPTIFGCPRCEN